MQLKTNEMERENLSTEADSPLLRVGAVRRWLYIAYLTIIYKVFHLKDEEHNGWLIKKRPITMIVIAPIMIPFYMLYGIVIYWYWATNWHYHWVEGEKQKLTWKQKLNIKNRLLR